MNTDINNAKPLLLLQQAFDALEATADSDIDFEDEEEEAEAVPAQYACRKIMEAMDLLQAANRVPEDRSDCHGPDWTDRDTEYLK